MFLGRHGARPGRRWRCSGGLLRDLAALLPVLVLSSCVTTYEDAPLVSTKVDMAELAVPQTIALGAAPVDDNQRALLQLYDGVLMRLEQAVEERDLPGVLSLLDSYERSNLPPTLRDRLVGYRAIARGLAFQRHAATAAALQLVQAPAPAAPAAPAMPLDVPPPLGEPLRFEFSLPASSDPARLGGRKHPDPVGFAVAIVVDDLFVDGGTRSHKHQDLVWIDDSVDLVGSTVLRLPIGLDLPGGDSVQRTVHVRIDLLPGYLQFGDCRAPIQRTSIAATSLTQWPRGYEAIQKAPLATLREAIRLGDSAHFSHVFLGASFARGADREAALALLVDQVRFGTQPQAVVAMATLRSLTGMTLSVGDRDAWLAWWQMRDPKRPF